MQYVTIADLRAANLRAIETRTLAAIKTPGASGCSYKAGCAIGCALTPETIEAIQSRGDDAQHVKILHGKLFELEDITLAVKLQMLHDDLARGQDVDRYDVDTFPVLSPFIGQPLTLDHYRAVIEALPA